MISIRIANTYPRIISLFDGLYFIVYFINERDDQLTELILSKRFFPVLLQLLHRTPILQNSSVCCYCQSSRRKSTDTTNNQSSELISKPSSIVQENHSQNEDSNNRNTHQ
ncbi:hypothetical protein ATJ93_4578 [Halopiger aswanensis]|uniref:Uncharacterized protein n=1 Tax=Halopiger aswanensis TaxID=148449 RepID=A0A419VWV7_9EURY|nr:hypothetical protein ATJ93_4578 [Halopiger aswanensis]